MITESPTLTNRVVTVEQCRQILIELGWEPKTIRLLLKGNKPRPFAAGSFWIVVKWTSAGAAALLNGFVQSPHRMAVKCITQIKIISSRYADSRK